MTPLVIRAAQVRVDVDDARKIGTTAERCDDRSASATCDGRSDGDRCSSVAAESCDVRSGSR